MNPELSTITKTIYYLIDDLDWPLEHLQSSVTAFQTSDSLGWDRGWIRNPNNDISPDAGLKNTCRCSLVQKLKFLSICTDATFL